MTPPPVEVEWDVGDLALELAQVTAADDKMQRLRKLFVIAIIIGVSLGAAVAVLRLAKGEGKFFYSARFTEFFVCEGPDPITGLPRESLATVPSTAETIYACGHLEASGKVPLHFLLFYEGQSTRWFDPAENYQTGYVFKELPQSWRKPGDYTVEVRLQRHRVASAEFRIVP
jgi:hypothetical protein